MKTKTLFSPITVKDVGIIRITSNWIEREVSFRGLKGKFLIVTDRKDVKTLNSLTAGSVLCMTSPMECKEKRKPLLSVLDLKVKVTKHYYLSENPSKEAIK